MKKQLIVTEEKGIVDLYFRNGAHYHLSADALQEALSQYLLNGDTISAKINCTFDVNKFDELTAQLDNHERPSPQKK